MDKNLIIVESKNKIKSIKKYVGDAYEVIASSGHIRELDKRGFGCDTKTWIPKWKSTNPELIKEINKKVKSYAKVYLATDPDREGEAISWHLFDILNDEDKVKCQRITFNEITNNAVNEAINNPRDIDMNLVYSQWSRRLLDRMVGYSLSNVVQRKLKAKSAGRVQSVALLFIVERFLEREKFVKSNWWTINTILENNIEIFLREINGKFEPFVSSSTTEIRFANENEANKISSELNKQFEVYKIDDPTFKTSKKLLPYSTDTLLTAAYSKYGWKASKTTFLSQKLFEGVKINNEQIALISYPRTDSNRMNSSFIDSTKKYIEDKFGNEFVLTSTKESTSKVKDLKIQDAHEAIRPIDINIEPTYLSKHMTEKDAKDLITLYKLIWTRTTSSLMNPPIFINNVVRFKNNDHKFYTKYTKNKFLGYHILPYYDTSKTENVIDLSYLKIGDKLSSIEKTPVVNIHTTEPPALYNEGSLVKALKEAGVGRPSTYSSMVGIVQSRGYVINDTNGLSPTDKGVLVITNLLKGFKDIVSKKFTVEMENDLDKISTGQLNWTTFMEVFNEKLKEELIEADKLIEKVEPNYVEGRVCPLCGERLVVRVNKYNQSEFIGCSGFSKTSCKYIEQSPNAPKVEPLVETGELCPDCGSKLVIRKKKSAKAKSSEFIACSSFPKCRFIKNIVIPNDKEDKKEIKEKKSKK